MNEIKIRCLSFGCDCNKFSPHENAVLNPILASEVCPYLVYISYPYYETFHAGGSFPWMRDLNSVIVSCPYSEAAVDMQIKRQFIKDKVEIYGEVINAKGNCLWGCKKGMRVEFDLSPFSDICFRAYHFLFPHIFSLASAESSKLSIQLCCPKSQKTVFEINKE